LRLYQDIEKLRKMTQNYHHDTMPKKEHELYDLEDSIIKLLDNNLTIIHKYSKILSEGDVVTEFHRLKIDEIKSDFSNLNEYELLLSLLLI
jgi:hypothetical protein